MRPRSDEFTPVTHRTVADEEWCSVHRAALPVRRSRCRSLVRPRKSTGRRPAPFSRRARRARRASRRARGRRGRPGWSSWRGRRRCRRQSARAVAAAMRMPVKVPGPTPASTRSTEPSSSPARSRASCTAGSSVSEAPRPVVEISARTSRSRARATVVTGVEASSARINTTSCAPLWVLRGSRCAWSGFRGICG